MALASTFKSLMLKALSVIRQGGSGAQQMVAQNSVQRICHNVGRKKLNRISLLAFCDSAVLQDPSLTYIRAGILDNKPCSNPMPREMLCHFCAGPDQRLRQLQASPALRSSGGYTATSGRLASAGGSGGGMGRGRDEPPSPVHRGGVDITYLRMHDVRLA
jgi:hypothetical protein